MCHFTVISEAKCFASVLLADMCCIVSMEAKEVASTSILGLGSELIGIRVFFYYVTVILWRCGMYCECGSERTCLQFHTGFGSEKIRIRVISVILDTKCFASILLADIH